MYAIRSYYATIPRAFLLMKVYCDDMLRELQLLGEKLEEFVGFGEVLPVMLVPLLEEFPFMFGSFQKDESFLPAVKVNVGVTVDAGAGLYIPVLKHADLLRVERAVEAMTEYKFKALRNSFEEVV